jgi:hypothetical protein
MLTAIIPGRCPVGIAGSSSHRTSSALPGYRARSARFDLCVAAATMTDSGRNYPNNLNITGTTIRNKRTGILSQALPCRVAATDRSRELLAQPEFRAGFNRKNAARAATAQLDDLRVPGPHARRHRRSRVRQSPITAASTIPGPEGRGQRIRSGLRGGVKGQRRDATNATTAVGRPGWPPPRR